MTIQKISFVAIIIALFVVVTFSVTNNAFAQISGDSGTGCSGCGGSTGGDVAGGGGTTSGGGSSIPAPTCDISTNISVVNSGDQYTISWRGTPATGATFEVNDYPVSAVGQKTYTFTAANYSRFVFTGINAGGNCVSEVRVTRRVVEAPKCESFTASPVTLPIGGGNVTLNWDTTNATNATLNGQSVAGDGSLVVNNVTSNRTFTLNLTNTVGQASCTAAVTVTPTPLAPICDSFTASPTSIVRGNSSTLTWNTTNADSVSINQAIGSVAIDGTRVVSPTNTLTYILTATKGTQTVTCEKTVTVTDVPTPLAPICDSFTASPVTINRGQSSQLTWATTNANSASINNAVGSVSLDGNVSVTPLVTTTYRLTAIGTNNQQVTCDVPVTVIQPETPTPITCAANVNFTANSNSIRRGDSSTLTWDTTGLTGVRFDNLNATTLDGSTTVSPNDTTTYNLIGTKGSETINCPVTVNVSTSNGGGGGGGSSAPKCTLKISDNKISLGERVTIKWDTTRATDVTLKDNHGKTLVDTDDKSSSEKKELYDGEITIRPDKDTTYTLVASKGSRDKTCKVDVDIEDNIVVTQVRDQQPLVTGIALTQVPYTGFKAGPFMTSVFYTLLAAWALYMAYVLVARRNGMSAFTPATVVADVTPEAIMFPEQVTTTPSFYQTPAPVVATTATIGYAAHVDTVSRIESQAHAAHVLLSADALAYLASTTTDETVTEVSATVFANAKETFPSEDGFVVITSERLSQLLA